ncbi:MAG TPA: class I SAM-dependent methyltransferase [Azospirillum sp.]|nr:class I SAM-dependent methyltransferase [Azospirillum sp.]
MAAVDPPNKGWFEISDLQAGDRTLAEQLTGLDPLFGMVGGASILDLGCAEGLISLEMMKAGAKLAHGVEGVDSRVETARRLFEGRNAAFFVADLSVFANAPPAGLLPSYDAVLLLSIAHKFKDPAEFIRAAVARCSRYVAVRLPAPVIQDRRSDYVPVDVPRLMASLGFGQIHDAPGPRAEWVGIFERA